jgi:enediyne biosynthesis protein E4
VNGKFRDVAPTAKINDYGVGRGSVVFDMDSDGDLDVLVVNQKPVKDYPLKSVTRLYRNDSQKKGNWFKVKLLGTNGDTRGIGSRVEVVVKGVKMIREIDGGSSHISQNSPVAHFGIGDETSIDSVIVKWIGGSNVVFVNQQANSILEVSEPMTPKRSYSFVLTIVTFLVLGTLAYFLFSKKVLKTFTPE